MGHDTVTRPRSADGLGAALLRALGGKKASAVRGEGGRANANEPAPAAGSQPSQILGNAAAHDAAGRYAESLAAIKRALETFPDDRDLLLARASTLYAWGRFREAYQGFLRAESAGLTGPTLDLRLGWTCQQLGRASEAEARMQRVVAAQPQSIEGLFGLGMVLASLARYDEAIATFERALEVAPDHKHCLVNIGICKLRLGDLPGAEDGFRKTIACDPGSSIAWMNLATTLCRQDRTQEGFEAFDRARELEAAGSENPDLFANYGNALLNSGRVQEALDVFERTLPQRPHVAGQGNYSMALLAAGRLAEGWNHYEFRWLQDMLLPSRANFEQPVWSGQDLAGKSILVRGEQGIGDVIQFMRYAPLLKALGAQVMLQNRPGMDEISPAFNGIDRVLEPNEALPPFDYYIPVMGLPRVFGTDLDSVPAEVPYLRIDPVRAERWAKRLGNEHGRMKVGVVWAGRASHERDAYRSIKLRALLPICDVEGVEIYSLQKGEGAAQLRELESRPPIVDLQEELTDFAETAAAIGQLDLVVSVDTSVAHLAGALGKPLWVLLPQPAEWRWLERGEESPWYPAARLFRQRGSGDWDELVARVKTGLADMVERRKQDRAADAVDRTAMRSDRAPRRAPRSIKPVQVAQGMSAAAEMRHGIFQYLPHDDVGRSFGWYGEWLEPQVRLLAGLLRLGQTVLEVDAGIGAHSVPLARAVGDDGHLMLYESRPKQKSILPQNLRVNGIGNVTMMHRSLVGSGQTSTGSSADGPPAETVDELELERLDWLKANDGTFIEKLVDGAHDTLWRLRPRIFAAASDEAAARLTAERLKLFGYRCWLMRTPLFSSANFYRHDRDVFSGAEGSAILAIPEEIEVDVALDGCVELE